MKQIWDASSPYPSAIIQKIRAYSDKGVTIVDVDDDDDEYDLLEKGYQVQIVESKIWLLTLLWFFLYILIPLFMIGWINEFLDAYHQLRSKHDFLVMTGPPDECELYSESYLMYFFRSSRKQICQDYYIQLRTTDVYLPNVWHVTLTWLTSSFLHPLGSILHTVSQLPWFLQYLLLTSLCLFICVWIATRGLSVYWYSLSSAIIPYSNKHNNNNNKSTLSINDMQVVT